MKPDVVEPPFDEDGLLMSFFQDEGGATAIE